MLGRLEVAPEHVQASLESEHRGRSLRSRTAHRQRRIIAALYTVVWGIALLAALSAVDGWWRLAVLLPFLIVPPDPSVVTESYEKYQRDWERANRPDE
jgi:hypothetical protein